MLHANCSICSVINIQTQSQIKFQIIGTFVISLKNIFFEQEYVAKLEFKTINFIKVWGNFTKILTV